MSFRRYLRRRHWDGERMREMEAHLSQETDDNIARGLTPQEARRQAHIKFGNPAIIREEIWQMNSFSLIENLAQNIRYAIRQLLRSPGFAATAVLMLAFGIGATTAIFSIVDGVLLRPLPFPNPNRLVTLGDLVSGYHWTDPGFVTAPEVATYQRDTRSFQSLGAFAYASYALSGVGQPAQIQAGRMTPSVFSVLGVAPLLGRVFTSEEDRQKTRVAVLSYAAWKSRFNANPHVIGTTIDLDREPYTIIGVMPKSFRFPLWPNLHGWELWVPMSFTAQELSPEAGGNWGYLFMVGRLKPGVTAAQAQDDARVVAAQIMRDLPSDLTNLHIKPVVFPLHTTTVADARPLLRILFLAVTVVLLIACANFAGLLLVRAIRRQRETAVRLALGASAKTLLGQTILESLVISVMGAMLGIGLAGLAIAIGRSFLPNQVPLTNQITLNWTVAAFALLLALLTGGLCGLAPGFAALRTNVNASLKEGARSGSASGAQARLRSVLVVAEIAIALVLLCASGLFLRSYMKMSDVDLGFQPNRVTTASYALPQKGYATQARVDAFDSQLLLRLGQLPGVQSVGLTDTPYGGLGQPFIAEGYVNPRGAGVTVADNPGVIGHYFKAMGIPILRGRYFTDSDHANGQLVVIVNHKFAEHYWPNQNPLGKRLRYGPQRSIYPWMTVVGEVADAKFKPDSDAIQERVYQPVAQIEKALGTYATPADLNGNGGAIVVRSALPPEQMEDALLATVRAIDPQLPLTQMQTLDQVIAGTERLRRFNTVVISSFALAAVLLAMLGISSIISFSVASRMQEMGIRLALGSQRSAIVRLVLSSGLKLAAVGCILGLAGAAAAASVLRSFLFHVSPFDPAVMALAALAVLVLAIAASALPALNAASVDPMQTLRGE
ncbi:MAG: ABC transporter permease [Acidobacteriaceae bacterium]